jgi:hypothetical protein
MVVWLVHACDDNLNLYINWNLIYSSQVKLRVRCAYMFKVSKLQQALKLWFLMWVAPTIFVI